MPPGWSGIGIPEHHLQVEGFELGQDPGLMAMFLGQHGPRLRINQFGYVLPTHNPLRVAEHAATLDHLLGGRLNVAFVRGYQARWFENYAAVRGVRSTGPWNRKSDEDAMNRELFEECVAIIKTAWTHDTFSFKGKYWSFPRRGQRQPHEHPVYLKYGRGVDRDGAIREVGIAPRPLQNPIPVYSGFTHSLQTSLYWARGGRQAHRDGQRDGLLRDALEPLPRGGGAARAQHAARRRGGLGRLSRAGRHARARRRRGPRTACGCGTRGRCRSARTGRRC